MNSPYAKVIVNPVAGGGATRRRWPHIGRMLREDGLEFDYQFTEGVGHGIEIAREAAQDGYELLVAVGGDGTANEVANGLVDSVCPARLGVISTGAGSDFARSLGIPRDYGQACSILSGGRVALIDVGVMEYGDNQRRLFVSHAAVGFVATVVEATGKRSKALGGTIPYVLALLTTILTYHNKDITLTLDGHSEGIRVSLAAFSNGAYFGGGMKVAPDAELGDGLLDVVVVGDVGRLEFLHTFPRVYNGTHLTHPKISLKRAYCARLESTERVLMEADGELIGETPVSFSVLPEALSVVI